MNGLRSNVRCDNVGARMNRYKMNLYESIDGASIHQLIQFQN